MGEIKVTFGAMETLASDVSTQVNNIEGLIENLRGQISNIETIWQGGAGEGFQLTKNNWNTAADHLKQVLAKILTAIRQSTEGYQATEQRNTARWDG
jgi:WXG100 family type VII secretion target